MAVKNVISMRGAGTPVDCKPARHFAEEGVTELDHSSELEPMLIG